MPITNILQEDYTAFSSCYQIKLPLDVETKIPSDDPVRLLSTFMEGMDLSGCEFAYMGQGEPGFNYPAVRQSILLTDCAMSKIDQNVSRHIISTCGIYDFIPSLISDISCGCFKNKVTLHFSLHAIDSERDVLMPVNKEYNYKKFITIWLWNAQFFIKSKHIILHQKHTCSSKLKNTPLNKQVQTVE